MYQVVQKINGQFAPGGSIGLSVGLRFNMFANIIGSLVVFGGGTPITLNDVNSTETKTRFGATWGYAFVIELTGKTQICFVGGWDHLGGEDGKDWAFNDKHWIALGIGFNFFD